MSSVIPFVAKKFDILHDILIEPFVVSTPVGDSMVAKRVYRNCPKILPNRVTHFELLEFDMYDFDVIFCMGLLHASFASID